MRHLPLLPEVQADSIEQARRCINQRTLESLGDVVRLLIARNEDTPPLPAYPFINGDVSFRDIDVELLMNVYAEFISHVMVDVANV